MQKALINYLAAFMSGLLISYQSIIWIILMFWLIPPKDMKWGCQYILKHNIFRKLL